jgi:hypothetical protein
MFIFINMWTLKMCVKTINMTCIPFLDNETSASFVDGCVVWQETGHDATVATIDEGSNVYIQCLGNSISLALVPAQTYQKHKQVDSSLKMSV